MNADALSRNVPDMYASINALTRAQTQKNAQKQSNKQEGLSEKGKNSGIN